ncbi:MAG: DUF3846 domain-containing protein [Clostridia bacterium]
MVLFWVDISKSYPKGSRIMVDNMEDPYSPIPSGTTATVDFIDDAGQLHCTYDGINSSLALISNEDSFHIIKEKENTIKVLVVEPMKEPYTKEIQNDYKAMQKVVGGYIEYVKLDEQCHLYCNEEGKIDGLELNRQIDCGDIICGTFFICQTDDNGDDKSLSESNIKKFTDRFQTPEIFETRESVLDKYEVRPFKSVEELLKALEIDIYDDEMER